MYRRLLGCTFTIFLLTVGPTALADTLRTPPGQLSVAIDLLAKSTGTAIIYQPVLGRAVVAAKKLRGNPDAMLQDLLKGMNLAIRRTGVRTILVERIAARPVVRRPEPTARPSISVGEIIVTATRRPTPLEDTPASVLALQGSDFERSGIRDLAKLSGAAPNLALANLGPGFKRLSLRGAYAPGEPTVGLYVGEVALVGPSGSTADPSIVTEDLFLADVDRVEILRGPQGTLFGSGSLAGAVRILFNKPAFDRMSAMASIEASSTRGGGEGSELVGMVNIPILDGKLAIRAVEYREDRAGNIDNIALGRTNINREMRTGGRVAVAWQASTDWKIDASLVYQRAHQFDSPAADTGLPTDITASPVSTPFTDRFLLGTAEIRGRVKGIDVELVVAQSRWKPHRRFNSTTSELQRLGDSEACGYYTGTHACSSSDLERFNAYILSQSPAVVSQPLRVKADSVEIRASGGEALKWAAGAIFSGRKDDGESRVIPYAATDTSDAPTSLRRFEGQLRQCAINADTVWKATAWLSLALGGRYFWYERAAQNEVLIPNLIFGPYVRSSSEDTYEAHGSVGRVRVELRPHDGTLLYYQLSSGFRPGGINVVPGLSSQIAAYRDDRLISHELGMRWQPLKGIVYANLTVFRQRWQNMQYSATTSDQSYSFITNIGDARIYGVEAGMTWKLSPFMSWKMDGTYNDARLTSDQITPFAFAQGRAGDRLPFVARTAFGSSFDIDRPISSRVGLLGEVQFRYTGRSRNDFARDSVRMGGLSTIDLSLGGRRDNIQAMVFIRNLANNRDVIWAYNSLGNKQIVRNYPLSIGISLKSQL